MGTSVNKVTQRQIFCFPLSNTIPPVLHMHLSPRPDPTGQFKTASGISGIATRLRDGPPGVRILTVAKENRLLQNVQTGCGTNRAFCLVGDGVRIRRKPIAM